MGSYYDIDAILADSQKVACTFNIEAPGLGFLAGDSNRDVSNSRCSSSTYLLTLLTELSRSRKGVRFPYHSGWRDT